MQQPTGIREAYNEWAQQYNTNKNRTRDLEAKALQKLVGHTPCSRSLELGCGTGKNTGFLSTLSGEVVAVDFSENMLAQARRQVTARNVWFVQADVLHDWHFAPGLFDLITFSLVLEHMENLDALFAKARAVAAPGARLYVGELHPFKQYGGTRARFESSAGREELTCFTHHVSDFLQAAHGHGFRLQLLEEWFDEDDRTGTPRLLAMLFERE